MSRPRFLRTACDIVFSSEDRRLTGRAQNISISAEKYQKLLNTCMVNRNSIAEENLRLDAALLESLRQLGVINTQYDLSHLCGMNESYYSSMKAKGYGLNLGSLVYLWADLARRSRDTKEPRVGAVLHQAVCLVQRTIEEKCRLRKLELEDRTGGSSCA